MYDSTVVSPNADKNPTAIVIHRDSGLWIAYQMEAEWRRQQRVSATRPQLPTVKPQHDQDLCKQK